MTSVPLTRSLSSSLMSPVSDLARQVCASKPTRCDGCLVHWVTNTTDSRWAWRLRMNAPGQGQSLRGIAVGQASPPEDRLRCPGLAQVTDVRQAPSASSGRRATPGEVRSVGSRCASGSTTSKMEGEWAQEQPVSRSVPTGGNWVAYAVVGVGAGVSFCSRMDRSGDRPERPTRKANLLLELGGELSHRITEGHIRVSTSRLVHALEGA
jgi:hypothetical protein